MKKNKFKSGAASFYIVAFSTLILVIIAASFASAIVAEIVRSSNDELSQSAYDAALAGVEDAKLAFNNYWNCIKDGQTYADELSSSNDITCQDIVFWVNHPDGDSGSNYDSCDMVGHILGRFSKFASADDTAVGVPVNENVDNGMDQAYTCTIIKTSLSDYRADLSSVGTYRVISPVFNDGAQASDVKYVKLSWYSNGETSEYRYNGVDNNRSYLFPSDEATVPPVVALQLVQTADNFSLSQLNGRKLGARTDRGMVYFIPTDNQSYAESTTKESYRGAFNGSKNVVTAAQVADTNDHSKDLPFAVFCNEDDEFACSVTVNLPKPIGGDNRNGETFMLIVSLPYGGQMGTDFSLEFYGSNDVQFNLGGEGQTQVAIDSTGRANDLYRRIEVRMESAENAAGDYPYYAIQLNGDNPGETLLNKKLSVTSECYKYNGYNCGNQNDYLLYNNY